MKRKFLCLIIFALMVIATFVVAVSAQILTTGPPVWDRPQGKQAFDHTHELPELADEDWTGAGSGQMYTTNLNDKIGIGTTTPQAKLHVDKDVSVTNQEVVRITFSNDVPSIGVRGIRVVSTPLNVKGTQIGVEAQTSKTGGPDAQRGSAIGFLSEASGFFLRGIFLGVLGKAVPNVLDNYDNTAKSLGLGGFFIAKPEGTLTLDNTGTYWVGGAYGEVAGTIDHTPTLGAVAGIIGVDNAVGSAKSYAGYFQGDVKLTEYIQLGLTSGVPPTVDCDQVSELGRMKVDDSGAGFLYVCTKTVAGIGWVAK